MLRRLLLTTVMASLVLTASVRTAAPPAPAPIAKWIDDLGSDDNDVWKRASDNLWHQGESVLPALRKAQKNPDPDIALRAALLISKLEWGILPNTPAAVVNGIDLYRGGSIAEKSTALTTLSKEGRPGLLAMKMILSREQSEDIKKALAPTLKALIRPSARDQIAEGDYDEAERTLLAGKGTPEGDLDLVAFWALSGRGEAKVRELEKSAAEDKTAARLGTLLHRALGNLPAARKLAEKADDIELLGGILDELEDYKELAKLSVPSLQNNDRTRAVLLHLSGDNEGSRDVLKRIPTGGQFHAYPRLFFFCNRINDGIDAFKNEGDLGNACALLIENGRWREAQDMKSEQKHTREQQGNLAAEQAILAHMMGDEELVKKRFTQVMDLAGVKDGKTDFMAIRLLASRLRAGKRINKTADAVEDVAAVIDRLPVVTATTVVRDLGERDDGDMLAAWWECLRTQNETPQTSLKRLHEWFTVGKAGEDFDGILTKARKHTFKGTPVVQEQWPAHMARICVKVGKLKEAEQILKEQAESVKTAVSYQHLGSFYMGQKRYSDAAEACATAMKTDPTQPLIASLRGAALVKLGQEKEGKELLARGRLLSLGDEIGRLAISQELAKVGLNEEADAERNIILRTAPFRALQAGNAGVARIANAFREGKHDEAARLNRRLVANMGLGARIYFFDARAYISTPARAKVYQSRAFLDANKIDDAIAEARRAWEMQPEEVSIVSYLVRGLEKADRKDEADKLFTERYDLIERACTETPKSAERHNRAAWMAARSGRQLDSALKHATQATELMPKAAAYHTTLAEVHFQRGDKDKALAAINEAIKLAPKQPYYEQYLKRIEGGDTKSEPPIR